MATLALLALGCASASPNVYRPLPDTTRATEAGPAPAEDRVALLRVEAARWAGTPHRYGGTDERGIDCSALVQSVFAVAFSTMMPRTTEEQVLQGIPVSINALLPGDLVFFRPGRNTRHVGIYLGEGAFLHASRSKGVGVSQLGEPYWKARYWTSRRILPEDAAPSGEPPVPAEAGKRTGW